MSFTPTQIATSIPLVTSGGELKFEASGLTISTGTKDAKLTTDADSLNSDTLFQAAGLASTEGLTVAKTSTFTGAMTAASTLTVAAGIYANGQIAISDAPTASTHAATKGYVDTQDALRLPLSGGTMNNYILVHQDASGAGGLCVRLRDVGNKPYIDWMDWAGNQLGYIQGTTANLNMYAKGDILLNSGGGQVRTSDAIYTSGGNNRFFGSATNFIYGGNNVHLDFYGGGGSVDSIGSRYGYIGYPSSGYLQIVNEVNSSSIFLRTDFAVVFQVPGEVARFQGEGLMIGKTSTSYAVEGHVHWYNGTHYSTTSTGNAANLYLNSINKTHAERWIWLGRNASWIGSVYQNGTSGAVFATTCDYRVKTIVGPVRNACERLMKLRPYRVTWNFDPERGETDDFMAHEVAEVVPDAVIGEKDAVDGEGKPDYQQMGESKLIPLMTASLQEVIERVGALERNIIPAQAA